MTFYETINFNKEGFMKKIDNLEKELTKHKKDNKARLKILKKLALKYKKISLEKSLEYSEQVLKIAEKINDPMELSEITRFIGEIKSRMSDFSESKKYCEISLSFAKKCRSHKLQISAINELARIYMKQSNFTEMLNCSLEMLAISKKSNHQESIAVSYHNLGIAYRNLGKNAKALENYLQALEIFRKSNDIPKVARVLNSIGIIHEKLNNTDKAFRNYREALKILEEINDNNFIYQTLNNLGNIYVDKGEHKKALKCYQRALEFEKKKNYQQSISLSLNNIGFVYEELGNNEKALDYYLQSLKIKEKLHYKKGIVQALNNIASVRTTLRNYREAEKNLERALKISEEIDSKNNLRDIYNSFYMLYNQEGKYRKALDFFMRYTQITEELQNIELAGRIEKLQIDYEVKQREAEAKILKKKNMELQEEIKKRARAETSLKKNLEQQKLLSEVSYLFTELGKFNQNMNKALRLIGKFTNVSRVYIFENVQDGKFTRNTFEWCNKGIKPQIRNLQDIPYEIVPSWKKIIAEKGMIRSSDISEIPHDIYDILAPQNIKSILVFPIYINDVYSGFMGFDECIKERIWEENEIELLKTIINEISNLFERRKTNETQEKRESELRNVFNAIIDLIFVMDKNDNFEDYFTSEETQLYKLPEKFLGKSVDEMMPNEVSNSYKKAARKVRKTGISEDFEYFLEINGEKQWFSARLNLHDDKERIVSSIKNITREKDIENILKNERNYYYNFVETMTDWVWEMDINGISTYSNKAIERILGYKHEEIVGKHISEFWPAKHKIDLKKFNNILKSGKGWTNYTAKFQHKNGSLVYVDSSAIPIYDSKHKLAGYRGVDRDITARKKTEEKLRQAQKEWEQTFDSVSDIIMIINKNYEIIRVNQAFYKNFGFKPEKIMGMSCRNICAKTFNCLTKCPAKEVLKNGKEKTEIIYNQKYNKYLLYSVTPIIDNHEIWGIVSISRDITSMKKTEEELKHH